MTHMSIQEVESDLQGVLRRIRGGEEVVLEENGVPFGKVTPVIAKKRDISNRIGLLEGQAVIPDDWKEIAKDDIEAHFGGL